MEMAQAIEEKRLLLRAKQRHESASACDLHLWEVPYYMGMLKAQAFQIDSRIISSYFSLEQCLKGLHLLCLQLFGLELRSSPMDPHEGWHPDVQKLMLVQSGSSRSEDRILGYIYFDLYPRANKYHHAAHFTIRCGKRLSKFEYQKPIVALVCNFTAPAPGAPTLLT